MERIQHHGALENDQIRNLIADADLGALLGVSCGPEQREAYRRAVLERIDRAQEELGAFDLATAMQSVMYKFGWGLHDVSDFCDYNSETYRAFIGTDEERLRVYPSS